MELQVNNSYHGFRLIEERKIDEINSVMRLFNHEKTGARLLSLENDDDNKVFSIGFRTPPHDSTGMPHIMEHSVLCGSRKFPTKEPFVDLLKGSLNTFLNAMTFSDKTIYPVASRNEKDFFNLMDVYLDAVFYPNIYKYPEIFMQEGWHYELENREDELAYKGVVYNEMKGAFSSPEDILFRKIQESLFPDTPYSMESGGDPDVMPRLTYEEFLEFHKKYYHPSNSYIFLYGNGNLQDELKFIDEKYLGDFGRINIDSNIPEQKHFTEERDMVVEYPISEVEDEKDNTYLNLNFVVGKATEAETYLAFEIIEHLLLETPAAPLKKALIEAELGKDVLGRFDNGILQPIFSIVVKNSNENEKERFKEVVFNTLEKLVKEGIDKELIEASINLIEFKLREGDFHGFPKGLLYYIKSMESWLYDEDPMMHIQFNNTLDKIKSALTTNYFEELIDKYILKNTHRSFLIVKPQKGLAEKKDDETGRELKEFKSGLPEEEIDKIILQTERLKKRQETPDAPEDLEKIPMVSLEDINPEAEKLPQEERKESGVKVLSHFMFTNKIEYVNLIFNTDAVEQNLIPYIGLMAGVMGKIGTEEFSYGELSNQINIHTGGIDFSADAYSDKEGDERFYPKFTVKSRALVDKAPKLFELLGEITGHSAFDDKKRVREIIREMKSRLEMTIFNRGHVVAANHLLSYFSPVGKYNEIIKGLSFYKFIAGLEKEFDSKADEIVNNLNMVSKHVFNKDNLIVSFTADQEDYASLKENLPRLLESLGNEKIKAKEYKFDLVLENEGLLTQAKVQYVAKGYNFKKLGYKYSGSMRVLTTIAGLDYLWNKVRVQGGAYGAFGRFDRNGNVYTTSYRDPNLKETLEVYSNIGEYIKEFEASEREMTKYIIGTISELDQPLTPSMKGERAAAHYISGLTYSDIQREREEVLNTKQEDIREFAKLADDVMKQNCFCVLGSEAKIKENKNLFKNLINVFE